MKTKPDPALAWPIDYDDGVLEIAGTESCRLKSYLCPAGKWTCGWGETAGVGPTTVWTQAYADQRFCDSLTERANLVKEACKIEPTKYQLAALVSFAYNYGGWRTSTVLKRHNVGDFTAAANAFGLVNKYTDPKTKKLAESKGLTARRAREKALYMKPDGAAYRMPQEVAPESKPMAGPIATGGVTVASAGGFVAALGPLGDHVSSVKTFAANVKGFAVDTLGVPADWFLPGLLIAAGLFIVYWRKKQRDGGWA